SDGASGHVELGKRRRPRPTAVATLTANSTADHSKSRFPAPTASGGWAAAEVAVAEAVAVALEAEEFGVVDEPVDHGSGVGRVAEDLAPGGEGLVAGDDQRGAFVAGADEREHQVGRLRVEGDVADLVDDQERCPEQLAQLVVEAALPLCVAEAGDPLGRGREADALAGEAGTDAERDRQVRLAGAGRAEQDDVVAGGEEVELAEMEDERLLHRALEAEVELLERLAGGEAGLLDPRLAAVRVSRCDLGLQQRLGEAL